MLKKLKITESLKSNEICTHERIGVVNGKVYVSDFINYTEYEASVNGEYRHINGILSELHDANVDIPTDITSYEIEPFDLNDFQDKSYLTLVYRDDDDDKYITLKMSLYEAPHFLSTTDLRKFGIK